MFNRKSKRPLGEIQMVWSKNEPGTELFSQEATLQVSSPLQRFTVEFGMESKWGHCAHSTRNNWRAVSRLHLQDCITFDTQITVITLVEVKPSVC